MKRARVIPVDDVLALASADLAVREGLAMADAMVLATARSFAARLVTSDRDLEGKPGVEFIP